MIWFRRILTIPITIIFLVLLVSVLLVTQVTGIVGSRGFYNDQMQKADMYNFVYDDLLPVAIDEIEIDEEDDIPIDIDAIEDDIISSIRKILPPNWLKIQFESATNALIPYIAGDTDGFTFTVELRDRAEMAADVIKEDMLQGTTFTRIYDGVTHKMASSVFDNLDELPYSLMLSEEQIENSLRTVIAEEWISRQFEAGIDSILPYLTRDSNSFTIVVDLQDQVDPAATAVIELLDRHETWDYLFNEMIAPIVEANLEFVVDIGFGVNVNQEEVISSIRVTLPDSWFQARLRELLDDTAAYIKGEADSIEVTVDLSDRKAVFLNELYDIADEKLKNLFYDLPQCSPEEFALIIMTLPPNTLPECRPSGGTYQQFKSALNIDIASLMDRMIGEQLPEQWVYTDADLRQARGEGEEDFLYDLREWVTNGWTYNEADLLDDLDSDNEETLDDVRGWIAHGYIVTEKDLREAIADTEEDLASFDNARRWIATGRTWLWSLWLILVLVLFCIGLLGGRSWRTRFIWTLVVILFSACTIYIATTVTYNWFAESKIPEMIDVSDYEGVKAVMADKGKEVIENISGSFVSGIKGKTIWMMIGSGIILLGTIGWSVIGERRRKVYIDRLRDVYRYMRSHISSLSSRFSRVLHR
jgi:hypothetical protein